MERRPTDRLIISGFALPLMTIVVVLAVSNALAIPWIIGFTVLIAMPVMAAGGIYLSELRTGRVQTPEWFPVDGRRQLRDQVPSRFHEEFSHETLDRTIDEEVGRKGRFTAFAVVYLLSLPAYALVALLAFSA